MSLNTRVVMLMIRNAVRKFNIEVMAQLSFDVRKSYLDDINHEAMPSAASPRGLKEPR